MWAVQTSNYLKCYDLQSYITADPTSNPRVRALSSTQRHYEMASVYTLLMNLLTTNTYPYISGHTPDSPSSWWSTLQGYFANTTESNQNLQLTSFFDFKMTPGESFDSYRKRFSVMSDENTRVLGKPLEEQIMKQVFLRGLTPLKYATAVTNRRCHSSETLEMIEILRSEATVIESNKRSVQVLSNSTITPNYTSEKRRRRGCDNCGDRANHETSACWRVKTCNNCGKIGHIVRVCRAPGGGKFRVSGGGKHQAPLRNSMSKKKPVVAALAHDADVDTGGAITPLPSSGDYDVTMMAQYDNVSFDSQVGKEDWNLSNIINGGNNDQ